MNDPPQRIAANPPLDIATRVIALLPGALVVYFGFSAGGFFPDVTAVATVVVAVALLARTVFAANPFAGFSRLLAVTAGALALFAGWTLLSSTWSDAPGRALVDFNRVLLYLVLLILLGSIRWRTRSARWVVRGLAAGAAVVCVAGLVAHLLPDIWSVPLAATETRRLSGPATYSNTMGLLASLGLILCIYLASNELEPPMARVLGAAGVPVLATTLYFTLSRGGIGVAIVGVLVYALAARSRGLLSAALATGPATAIALGVAYGVERSVANPSEGIPEVALTVALCALGAAIARLVLLSLDRRLARVTMPRPPRPLVAGVLAVALTASVAVALALGAPAKLSEQYRTFVSSDTEGNTDLRSRLTDTSNHARFTFWEVALEDFERSKLRGGGAGTYELAWESRRPNQERLGEAHSLYVEVLGELGIVGLALIAVTLGIPLFGAARRLRGKNRALYAALLAIGITWALHAAVDWDWEMPVVTIWFFTAAGLALARRRRRRARHRPSRRTRAIAAAAISLFAVTPVLMGLSEARLGEAARAYTRGDCEAARDSANASISAISARPEPYEILGYCDVRRRSENSAVEEMRKAVDRDPNNYEFHYALAVAQGAAGLDPRREASTAQRLNPLSPMVKDLVEGFSTRDPQRWKREAMNAVSDLESL